MGPVRVRSILYLDFRSLLLDFEEINCSLRELDLDILSTLVLSNVDSVPLSEIPSKT